MGNNNTTPTNNSRLQNSFKENISNASLIIVDKRIKQHNHIATPKDLLVVFLFDL